MQFGQFEENGTLPNMIAGHQAANRDTSDAPLWFFTACNDLLEAEGDEPFFRRGQRRTFGRRNFKINRHGNCEGTPNGVHMDPESALVYSPGHFTWMDTDHPAGTPRQGYPVEIQALWIAALDLLARIDGTPGSSRLVRAESQGAEHLCEDIFGWRTRGISVIACTPTSRCRHPRRHPTICCAPTSYWPSPWGR